MNKWQKFVQTILRHKVVSGLVILAVIFGSYFVYQKINGDSAATRYVLAAVEKGTLVAAVSGTGQISASDQVDIKPKVSGEVIYFNVKNGQEVKTGTLLAQLDSRNAQKSVRDAEVSLESAQLNFSNWQINQEDELVDLQDAIETAQKNLTQSYQDAFSAAANTLLDLSDILSGLRSVLYGSTIGSSGQINTGAYQDLIDDNQKIAMMAMINRATNDYLDAYNQYTQNRGTYQITDRFSTPDQITTLLAETLETSRGAIQTAKDEQNILDAVAASLKQYRANRPVPTAITVYQTNVFGYLSKLNSHLSNLDKAQNSIDSAQRTLTNAQKSLDTAQRSGPTDLIVQQNNLKQRQDALQDVKDSLANYYIRAPFDGVIAKAGDIKKGDSISGSALIATLITKKQIAEISLNEIDAAKLIVGQKTTLTFDAVEGLTLTGKVADIESLGTVSQGVVTYNAKISLDTQDERIKPGMSAIAAVVTDTKQNVLMIPNSAVKLSGDTQYVEVVENNVLQEREVEIGLANDTMIEIINGLNEGEQVVTQTITGSSSPAGASTRNSNIRGGSFGIPGMGGVMIREIKD